jgi:hypothetical protein
MPFLGPYLVLKIHLQPTRVGLEGNGVSSQV